MHNSTASIFGIPFPEETLKSVCEKVQSAWSQQRALRIATANPEFLVQTKENQRLRETLQAADIRAVDGVGLWLCLRLCGWRGERVTGAALTEDLLRAADKKKLGVVVILPEDGLSSQELVAAVFQKKYPGISLAVHSPSEFDEVQELLKADLYLVALGIPEQEYLGASLKKGVVIGVGGAIDFLTGTQKRAPKIFQILGIEWFWRLLMQPKRFRRIWRAVAVFPFFVVVDFLRASFKPRLLQ